jgi:hypothetical protein
MPVKRYDNGREVVLGSDGLKLRDNRSVSGMNAVKFSNA